MSPFLEKHLGKNVSVSYYRRGDRGEFVVDAHLLLVGYDAYGVVFQTLPDERKRVSVEFFTPWGRIESIYELLQ